MSASRPNFDPTLYLVTDRRIPDGSTVEGIVEAALKGDGSRSRVTTVQLRDKNISREESLKLGQQLRQITRQARATFIVNDDIELAAELKADGVHLGQDDRSLSEARETLGADAIIGISAHCEQEAEIAIAAGVNYLGVGCIFGTTSKGDAGSAIGADRLAEIVRFVDGRVPVVAIGGVNLGNARFCKEAGADGIAVISAVMTAADPGREACELNKIMSGS